TRVRAGADPGEVAIWAHEDGRWRGDGAEDREHPWPVVTGVEVRNARSPGRGGGRERVGGAEVEQKGARAVEELEHAAGAVGGDEVEVGHATAEEGMAGTEVVVDAESGEL